MIIRSLLLLLDPIGNGAHGNIGSAIWIASASVRAPFAAALSATSGVRILDSHLCYPAKRAGSRLSPKRKLRNLIAHSVSALGVWLCFLDNLWIGDVLSL
jgi:hypothetical protein